MCALRGGALNEARDDGSGQLKDTSTASKDVVTAPMQVRGTRSVLYAFIIVPECFTSKKQRVSFFFVA